MKFRAVDISIVCVIVFLIQISTEIRAQTYNMSSGTINACAGTFYDDGGPAANYTNTNRTQTFCSSSGNCIRFTFTQFRTQNGNDILTIYDGPNTSSPVIGTYSGNTSPGVVTASTGCITFEFTCSGNGTRQGWTAAISCVPCVTTYNMPPTTTTYNLCGANFFDSGGPGGNYSANENRTVSFCSNSPGQCIQAVFNSFNVSNDHLFVYDGPNITSPLIGDFTGTTIPPLLLSSSGCLTFRFTSNASQQAAGWSITLSCDVCPTAPAPVPTYLHPTAGVQGTYLGSQLVNTCGGTYADNGGTASNYSNNISNYYRTFCPNQVGKCLRVQFYNYSTESGYDGLTILNGPAQNSPQFAPSSAWSGTLSPNSYQGAMAVGLGPYTSTDQSGCLTFAFYSDITVNLPGWLATFDCVPCNNGPNGIDNNDCINSSLICANTTFSDNSTGPGLVSELTTSNCVPSEAYSNWYKFTVNTSGTLGFTLASGGNDYDFALFGPNVNCAALGNPLRCSYSGVTTNTGLNFTATDQTEGAAGDGWVQYINVTAGQTFYLCVSRWDPGGNGFGLTWTGTASLDCTPLPVEWLAFDAVNENNKVVLKWTTASEFQNDRFEIERSNNGIAFDKIGEVKSQGNSHVPVEYNAIDFSPMPNLNYYRIKQVDLNGNSTYSRTLQVATNNLNALTVEPNPATGEILFLNYSSVRNEKTVIKIYNAQGNELLTEQINSIAGYNKTGINISSLPQGVYVVVVQNSNASLHERFVRK